jgi:hypothetical protein
MAQLGVHIFSIVESVVVKRKTDRKYYEFLLHHFIAVMLILISLLINLLAMGTVVLFLHDISDMFTDMLRIWVETKFRRTVVDLTLFAMASTSWFYTRIVVFPFCIVPNLY